MRSLSALLIMLTVSPLFSAEMATKNVSSKVASVTVYQTTALITREVIVPEGTGLMELIVSPMPAQTMPTSLYAEGAEGIRILSTRFRTRAVAEDTREEVRKIDVQIKAAQQKQETLTAEAKTNDQNMALFTKMETFTTATMNQLVEKGMLNSESVIALATFIIDSRTKRSKEQVALQQQIAANQEQIEFLKRQLQEKSAGSSRTERDGVVVIDKTKNDAAKLKLNYLVGAAGWRPMYKFRAAPKEAEPVVVEYLANVEQQTGEDWENVTVSLSTAQPMLNAAPPELKTLEVAVVAPGQPNSGPANEFKDIQRQTRELRTQGQQLYNMRKADEGGKVVNDAAALEQYRDVVGTREDLLKGEAALVDEGPSVTYHLKNQLSLPSRSDEQVIEIARLDMPAGYFYKAVPVLTPHIYKLANLTNKTDYVLLPGDATMYLGTDFVGQTRIPLVAIGKQFTVGFGVDPQIQVVRQLLDKVRSQQGGNSVTRFDYRILVSSYKSTPVDVQVWDRMPHADGNAIAVTLVTQKPELSTDTLYARDEKPKNLLRWDVKVAPGQNGEKPLTIDYQYKIELDRTVQIGAFQAK